MTYEINAAGLRGPLPEPGRDTVVVMGDSFTFGEGVPYDRTFVAHVEHGLTSFVPPPAVVDAGIPGYSTEQELTRLPEWMAAFRPRAVVLVYLLNDAIPDVPDPDDRPPVSEQDEEAQRAMPAVWRIISNVLDKPRIDRQFEHWYESFYLGERRDCWTKTRSYLAAMRRLTQAKGTRFGVVLFPVLHRLKENPFAPIHQLMRTACHELDVPFLDLTAPLAAEPDNALWLHPRDHHPNARAHELAGSAMTPFVESLLR